MSTEPERHGALGDLARYSGLGLQFAATVGVFAFLGRWLDGRLGSSPGCLLAGVFLGFGLGLYSMTKKLPSSRTKPRARNGPTPPA
jgi:F0F1-type ATP synthase assembly protein I